MSKCGIAHIINQSVLVVILEQMDLVYHPSVMGQTIGRLELANNKQQFLAGIS